MTTNLPPPLPESYWVLPGQFLAGEYPASLEAGQTHRRLLTLLDAGIDTFIDLTESHELAAYDSILNEAAQPLTVEITYQRFPIPDGGLLDRSGVLRILDSIDGSLAFGHHVYLHCWGGVGRTGMIAGCFLVRHGLTGQQAVDQLAAWWQSVPKSRFHPRSPETDQQVRFILGWQEPLSSQLGPPKRGDQRPA